MPVDVQRTSEVEKIGTDQSIFGSAETRRVITFIQSHGFLKMIDKGMCLKKYRFCFDFSEIGSGWKDDKV